MTDITPPREDVAQMENGFAEQLEALVTDLAQAHAVPGAAVAVLHRGRLFETAAGVANLNTGVPATVDTLFQIGSITKVWTATLVMQLVEEGVVGLDDPVVKHVPLFGTSDPDAAARITVRQLLSHQGGFEGDMMPDTGDGDDAADRYLELVGSAPQYFEPGRFFSYCNTGFVVLGRLVERYRDARYRTVVRERLFEPLGLPRAAARYEEALLHSASIGHVTPEPGAEPVPAPVWSLPPVMIATGSLLAMPARELAAFGRLHVQGGMADSGARLLEESTIAAMREAQVDVPVTGYLGDHWGLGWEIFDWDGGTAIGHDGGTIGQKAFLRILPADDLVIVVLTNGGNPYPLSRAVVSAALERFSTVRLPELPRPGGAAPTPADVALAAGRYGSDLVEVIVEPDGDALVATTRMVGEVGEGSGMGVMRDRLVRAADSLYLTVDAEPDSCRPHVFLDLDGDGRAEFLHIGVVIPRSEGA